jgi:serine/threonine protein kinase
MHERAPIDWEAFYRSYRKPGYVPGFEILHKIGVGAFGMVFKARKQSIEKDYAIKFLKVDDEGARNAIVRELDGVRFFAQVDHPNLVSIEDQGEVDGIPYLVMNHAGDATLRSRLDGGALPRDEALRVFLQVVRGVEALHRHSLVHFDLKPANVFLKGDLVRVGDYGLSRLVSQSGNSLSFGRGTPHYMAPELLRRRGDHRSDLYSLGVLLYECLTGTVPFAGESQWEVLRKHETETPHLPASIADPERAVIARCLQKEPEDRFENAAAMLAALAPAPATPSVPAPAPHRAPLPPRRPPVEERAGRGATAVLALIPALLLAMLFLAPESAPPPPIQRLVFERRGAEAAVAPAPRAARSEVPRWLDHALAVGAGQLLAAIDTSDLDGELGDLVDRARRDILDGLRDPRERSVRRMLGRLRTTLGDWARDREERPR